MLLNLFNVSIINCLHQLVNLPHKFCPALLTISHSFLILHPAFQLGLFGQNCPELCRRDGPKMHRQEMDTKKLVREALKDIQVYHTHDENRGIGWRM